MLFGRSDRLEYSISNYSSSSVWAFTSVAACERSTENKMVSNYKTKDIVRWKLFQKSISLGFL